MGFGGHVFCSLKRRAEVLVGLKRRRAIRPLAYPRYALRCSLRRPRSRPSRCAPEYMGA
ncbi:hypothetical protein AZA_88580 [Nitrospirillum viridazoti Y2]|nr:hypothetical protein AZA_88580 [Nitrospirillum amazonense Y2]